MAASGAAEAELTHRTGHELAEGLRSGAFSALELTDAHLASARAHNHALNAWLTIDTDRARAEAEVADTRLAAARKAGPEAVAALPPMVGMPVALKDLVSLAGGQCTAGSRILEGYRAPYDAHITERLRAA
ncbi:MAG TPA: amidase family protein, partial [Candidatus Limnocylindrales bacterium]